MQSENLSNLHIGWIIGGWLVAVSVTAGLYLGSVGLGLDGPPAVVWVGAMAGGFFVGGLVVGMRWSNAPILHGAAITFVAVVVWFFAALLSGPGAAEAPEVILGSILVQLVASSAGGWAGRRVTMGR